MKYTFDIIGVSPVLQFFHHQQQSKSANIEYLGIHRCTLDALMTSIDLALPHLSWDIDGVRNTVINFWMDNSESIRYWQARLTDAGNDNLLVTRVAEIQSLQAELETLFKK
ncbi:hypothetical protein [Calothrix sp. 336/3]|uniref:hypothetical protein n=1 Tax=Calothrix sp. 336/3 TaxID=1337936 RepID=UPI0004E2B8B9|nr:hypothetical protein [Calothrix sp. 336/3]AKG21703.1 hypothetical protein IJ00_10930 [Calothrix sp. 336/3]